MRAFPYGRGPIGTPGPQRLKSWSPYANGHTTQCSPRTAADFTLASMDNADKIHAWNSKWAWPRLICATMDMFFDDVAKQADPSQSSNNPFVTTLVY